jgi:hypothetical protein
MTTILYSLCTLFASLAWLSATGDVISAWIVGSVVTFGAAGVLYLTLAEPVQTASEAE